MRHFNSIHDFWAAYFKTDQTTHGFDEWVIASMHHIFQETAGQFVIEVANPFTKKSHTCTIEPCDESVANEFKYSYTARLVQQYPARFQSFNPIAATGFAEYDSWENFESAWLVRNGKPLLSQSIPLLFDHITDQEYAIRTKLEQPRLEYQSLRVVLYVNRNRTFYDFFIKGITSSKLEQVKQLITSRLYLYKNDFYS